MRLWTARLVAFVAIGLAWMPLPSKAQDKAAVVTALRDLEGVVQTRPNHRLAWNLLDISDAYRDANAPLDASRLLADAVKLIPLEATEADGRNLLRMIVQKYEKLGERDAIQRLVSLDPNSIWAADAAIRSGDKKEFFERLSSPNLFSTTAIDAIGLYMSGVLAREGLDGAKRAILEIGAFIDQATSGRQTPASQQLAEGWSRSHSWLAALLIEAHRAGRINELVDWLRQTAHVQQNEIDRAARSAIYDREKDGDQSLFRILPSTIQDSDERRSIVADTVSLRLERGDIQSAITLARLILDTRQHMDEAMETVGHFSLATCGGPLQRALALDRSNMFVKSGFIDCGAGFPGQMPVPLVLGAELAKARQYDLARTVLDYSLSLDRRRNRPDKSDEDKPCPPSQVSLELADAYYTAGALELVYDYADLVAHTCVVTTENAYFVARMLTLLGSPDDVPQLILSKRYQHEAALPQLNLGLISGLTERGRADRLPAALQAARDKADAVAVMHRALPDVTTVDGRRKAAVVLQAALPLLRNQYLIDQSVQSYSLRASQWMVDYVQAGMAPQVSGLIDEMAERLVKAINSPSERTRASRPTYLEAIAPDLLGFATLFLASRLTNPRLEVKAWASQLTDEKLQRLFLAVSCEALALTGDFDAAVRLAEQLTDFGAQPDMGDYFGPRVYAWYPLISFQARSGQLSDAYRLAVEHKIVPILPSLIAFYEDGLAERSRR